MRRTFLIGGLIVIICAIAYISFTYYIILPIKITFVKPAETATSNYGDYWVVINNENQIKSSDIDISDFSFNDSSYIITFGRELKELRYKRLTHFPFTKTRYGIAYLAKEYHSNKMFIYRLPKNIKIFYDFKAMEKDNVQIEK